MLNTGEITEIVEGALVLREAGNLTLVEVEDIIGKTRVIIRVI